MPVQLHKRCFDSSVYRNNKKKARNGTKTAKNVHLPRSSKMLLQNHSKESFTTSNTGPRRNINTKLIFQFDVTPCILCSTYECWSMKSTDKKKIIWMKEQIWFSAVHCYLTAASAHSRQAFSCTKRVNVFVAIFMDYIGLSRSLRYLLLTAVLIIGMYLYRPYGSAMKMKLRSRLIKLPLDISISHYSGLVVITHTLTVAMLIENNIHL